MRRGRGRRHRARDQRAPNLPEETGWVEFGGDRVYAVDVTPGGAPIALTEDELENRAERTQRRPHWADGLDVVRAWLDAQGVRSSRDAVGRVRFIGEGLSNVVYGTTVRLHGRDEAVVVKLPSPRANPDRDRRLLAESRLLPLLAMHPLPFRVPRSLGTLASPDGCAAIEEWVEGMTFDLRASRFPGGRPWDLVASIAAAVHALDPEPFRHIVQGHATRRAHALHFSAILGELDEPEARDSLAWIQENLPPDTPARLLHDDLLGQNLRRSWETDDVAVIDWAEAELGDPAYELAIVTGGTRKPFERPSGMADLLDAYNRVSPIQLSARDVHLYELGLVARWYCAATRDYGNGSAHAENQRRVWRSVLGRAQQAP